LRRGKKEEDKIYHFVFLRTRKAGIIRVFTGRKMFKQQKKKMKLIKVLFRIWGKKAA